MPINVLGNSLIISEKKLDTSIFVQTPFLRPNYIKSNLEEDIEMKNQFKIKNLIDPISIREACSKIYVDNKFKNDNSFNDVALANIKIVKVNYQPAVIEHLTPNFYVDNKIDEPNLVRNNQHNTFNKFNLIKLNSFTLNTQAVIDNQVITKAHVV